MVDDKLKVLITGASGMLGTALIDYLSDHVQLYATSRTIGYKKKGVIWKVTDLQNKESFNTWVRTVRPDVFIHCAALTNVDLCENQVEQAELLHIGIPKSISEILSEWNGHFIYISTDAVFDGTKSSPYREEDPVSPINIYGKTKAQGEKIITSYSNGLVLRTNIFGYNFLNRQFFAEWVINGLIKNEKLTLFTDVIFSPIHVTHLSNYILTFINRKVTGLLNAGGKNVLSKYEFGLKLSEIFNFPANNIVPCLLEDVPLKATRSKNMSLSTEKLSQLNILPYDVIDGIKLLKEQQDNGWMEKFKNLTVE